MSTSTEERRGARLADGTGAKFLTFFLGEEEHGVEILSVREIIGLMKITPIPQTPHYVRGIINLRGRVIPVVDLRLKFSMESIPDTEETCIIVVDADGTQLGVAVDRVSEVREMNGEDIEDAPTLGGDINADYILGIGKGNGRVTLLLDLQAVFPVAEISTMVAAA